jgi:hypothetical protein
MATQQPENQNRNQKSREGVLGGVRQVAYPIEPDAEGNENKERADEIPFAARTRYLVHPAEGQKPVQREESKEDLALNQPTLLTGNEEAAEVAVIGADRNFTVTPANPTPPTNIPSAGETPPNTPELVLPRIHGIEDMEGNERDKDDPRTARTMSVETEEWQDPSYFAPQTTGMPHEAAGTEIVNTVTDEASEPIPENPPPAAERVASVSAGHEPYVIRPNVTHPSNDVNYEEPQLPPPTPTPPDGGTGEPAPPMDLTSLDPASAPVGTGAITLTVNGTGFTSDCVIVVNDIDLPTTFVSETQLTSDAFPVSGVAETVNVEVERGDESSDMLTFDFTAAEEDESSRSSRKSERRPKRKEPRKGKKNKR